jgi:hypothetical protein
MKPRCAPTIVALLLLLLVSHFAVSQQEEVTPISFLSKNGDLVKRFLALGRPAGDVNIVCVVGRASLALQLLQVFSRDAHVVFFDPTPVAGEHSGGFLLSKPHPTVRMLHYVGQPQFTFRRFMSDHPGSKCHLVLLDSSVHVKELEIPERLVDDMHTHTWRLASGAPHLVIAAEGWKDALSGRRRWIAACPLDETIHNSRLFVTNSSLGGDLKPSAGIILGQFRHEMPFYDAGVARIVESGTWADADLTADDVVSAALTSEMARVSGVKEGHSAQLTLERKIYKTIAALPRIKTICEIGFNAGHSAALWLLANPTAKVVMFDLFVHAYSRANENFLRTEGHKYGLQNVDQRLVTVNGSSLDTVPKFAKDFPDIKCDLLSVDGGHFDDVPLKDLQNMKLLANKDFNLVLVDDTNCDGTGCVDGRVSHMVRQGILLAVTRVAETMEQGHLLTRGVTLLQYTRDAVGTSA